LLPSEVKGERICKNVSLRYGLRKVFFSLSVCINSFF
jgi:hypothetical protein